jgi:hypothetical protein
VSGCSRRLNPTGASTAGAEAAAPASSPAHNQIGQIGKAAGWTAPAAEAPDCRDEDQRHQPEHAIHQHHGGGQRPRARRFRGVADANHVAADVARQKIVEEAGDQE